MLVAISEYGNLCAYERDRVIFKGGEDREREKDDDKGAREREGEG